MDTKPWMKKMTGDYTSLQPWTLPDTGTLAALAECYAPIGLEQMGAVALLNRTDTKFLMTTRQLLAALSEVKSDYWMLSVCGRRLNHYRTLYFDTPDFALYHMHVNGRSDRYKVRSREYTDSTESFFEVKHKTNNGRTIKERISTPSPVIQITIEAEDWLKTVFPYRSEALEPKLWNTFTRLTLVSKQCHERVTLDVDLAFSAGGKTVRLGNVAVAELKRDRENRASPFFTQMRAQKIIPLGFSKYCIGVSHLYDQVKKNALKPKLLQLSKMTQGGLSCE